MARLSELTDPHYLEGLTEWPLDEVRARRDEATEVETGLSYLRRIAQGRLDIVLAEQRHRASGTPADLAELVQELPTILGGNVHAPGLGRLPAQFGPSRLDEELEARLEAVLPPTALAGIANLGEEELAAAAAGLSGVERAISASRRAVFEVLDQLQEEVVRRYRTGEATVDSLLP